MKNNEFKIIKKNENIVLDELKENKIIKKMKT